MAVLVPVIMVGLVVAATTPLALELLGRAITAAVQMVLPGITRAVVVVGQVPLVGH
jgi:hypothetical protein